MALGRSSDFGPCLAGFFAASLTDALWARKNSIEMGIFEERESAQIVRTFLFLLTLIFLPCNLPIILTTYN